MLDKFVFYVMFL